jgi:hypothetical protein
MKLQDLNDDTFLLDALPDDDQQSLAEPSTVDTLLRFYGKFLIDKGTAVAAGTLSDGEAQAAMQAEAERLQGIFYGQDEGYKGTHWHQPSALGQFLVGPAGLEGAPDDAVARLLKAFWAELAPMLNAFLQDEIDQEMFIDVMVQELIERHRHYLMGLPLPADYYGDEDDAA